MPMLIEHIDAIARQKQRDVLYLTFQPPGCDPQSLHSLDFYEEEDDLDAEGASYNWREDPKREEICQWLTAHQINWQECGDIANENVMCSYEGQIYLDVPFDENDPQYCLLRDYLEHPDGTMRFATMTFYYLPLASALKNAHHDEPGFWEKWAENF